MSRGLQVMLIVVDNVNQVEFHKWVRHIFKNTWHIFYILYLFFLEKSIRNGLRYIRGLQVMLINTDNISQAISHKWVCHIFENTWHMYISNFSRKIDWEWSNICHRPQQHQLGWVSQVVFSYSQKWSHICQSPPSHAHRRHQHQPGQLPQVGSSYFQKHIWHMFYIQFFKENQLRMVWQLSEVTKLCSSTLTMSNSPTSWLCIFSKTHMAHALCIIFQEKSIGIRYVRHLQVMLIDVSNSGFRIHIFF